VAAFLEYKEAWREEKNVSLRRGSISYMTLASEDQQVQGLKPKNYV
jgi:hypothetical protein